MKPADIRALNADAQEDKLRELYGEWRDLRFQEAVGQLTATARIRQIRRDIARIKTIQGEAERAASAAAAKE
jgi:large subunit ribosomal protein L29